MKGSTRKFLDDNKIRISNQKQLEWRGPRLNANDLKYIKYAIDNHPVDWEKEEEADAEYWKELLRRLSPPPNMPFETFKVQKDSFTVCAQSDGPVDRAPYAVKFTPSVLEDLIMELGGPDEIMTVEGFKA